MLILEKIEQQIQARHWTDSIPLEYHYTAGVAGEEFRRELKENGKLLTSKCPKCKTNYLPARMFCPTCFLETTEKVSITGSGYVSSFTIVAGDKSSNKLAEPTTVAIIKVEGVKGAINHKIDPASSAGLTLGTKVEPVFRERKVRTGALADILFFRPTGAVHGGRHSVA